MRFILPLLAITALTACVSNPPTTMRTATDGMPFQLQVGESIRLPDGGILRYERIAEDSRCPPDVQCVWAGDASVLLSLSSGGTTRDLQLHTTLEPRQVSIGPRVLALRSLETGGAPRAIFVTQPASWNPA